MLEMTLPVPKQHLRRAVLYSATERVELLLGVHVDCRSKVNQFQVEIMVQYDVFILECIVLQNDRYTVNSGISTKAEEFDSRRLHSLKKYKVAMLWFQIVVWSHGIKCRDERLVYNYSSN